MLCAVVLPRLVVLVVDVAFQVSLGPESLPAASVRTLVRSLMISFVMTGQE